MRPHQDIIMLKAKQNISPGPISCIQIVGDMLADKAEQLLVETQIMECPNTSTQLKHKAYSLAQIIGAMLADKDEQLLVETYIAERASRGLRSLGVAQSSDGGDSWRLVGLISLLDPPRPDSAATIKRAQELGVEVWLFQVLEQVM